jgi:hypothetical protein
MAAKRNRTYQISYKHEEYGSNSIGCDFASVAAAQQKIKAIKDNPGQAGYADWLKDACLWVSDNKGNIY